MKKALIAALAIVAMMGCSDENSQMEAVDPSGSVAAVFSAAEITRVADGEWETNDKIGISMTESGDNTTLADGDYENVSYTVNDTATGTFTPTITTTTIYLPADGTEVDFYAYYPHATLDEENNIAVSVASKSDESQDFTAIDILAAKVSGVSKSDPNVSFTDDNKFTHQLSKLVLNIVKGDGVTSLAGLETTTIKGQYTTAKYNIYSGVISSEGGVDDITAVTASDGTKVEAIMIPTAAIAGSTIEFVFDDVTYTLDTSDFVFEQGKEHKYEITISKRDVEITSATISGWDDGTGDTGALGVKPLDIELSSDGEYYIYTGSGLKAFASIVNSETSDLSGYNTLGIDSPTSVAQNVSAKGVLKADVNLGGNSSNQWTPIGSGSNTFKGTFDGGGHVVSGLYIDDTNANNQGLFGYIEGATIENLGVSGVVKGGASVGGVVGSASYSTSASSLVKNCYNSATVTGYYSEVGGVVGYAVGSAEYSVYITSCYNSGDVTGGCNVGGVVGNASNSTITSCYNSGDVTGSSSVGGVVGNASSITITSCYSYGSVSSTSTTYIGGVLGYDYGSTISYCYYDESTVTADGAIKTPSTAVGGSSGGVADVDGKAEGFDSSNDQDALSTLLTNLNEGSDDWEEDTATINNGYPILSWQVVE